MARPEKEDKNFFNVGELSERFNKWAHAQEDNPDLRPMDRIQAYQAAAMFAIAQQLSVISGTLKDLLQLCQRQEKF